MTDMFIFLLTLTIVVFALILIVGSIQPIHSELSLFELKRRSEMGDKQAEIGLEREMMASDILALKNLILIILFVKLFGLLLLNLDWALSIGWFILALIAYCLLAGTKGFSGLARKIYRKIERPLFGFFKKYPAFTKFIGRRNHRETIGTKIGSNIELKHLIQKLSPDVISDADKALVSNSVNFSGMVVGEIMTPRKDIICVKQDELLGPLVLDDLHKSGHRHVLVIDKNIDNVLGIMSLDKLFNLDHKRSITAGKSIDQEVFFIGEKQSLRRCLDELAKTHADILVVINDNNKTVGVITLEDIVEKLFGKLPYSA